MSTLTRKQANLTLSDGEVIEGLMRLAAERPDYVYDKPDDSGGCFYFHTHDVDEEIPRGQVVPGCIVGHLMERHGMTVYDLNGQNTSDVSSLCASGYLTVSARARQILALAQMHQDKGATWFDAVARALTNQWTDED